MSEFEPNEKIVALIDYLKKMQNGEKALVYTSFLGMLTLIAYSLRQQGIRFEVLLFLLRLSKAATLWILGLRP